MPVTVANSVFCAPLLLPGPALNVTQNLAIFDLDHTLLAGDSDHLWGEFLIEQGLVDAAGYRQANDRFYAEYQAGTLDIQDFAAFAFAPLVKYGRAQLAPLRSQFVEQVIAPLVAASAPALLERHRSAAQQRRWQGRLGRVCAGVGAAAHHHQLPPRFHITDADADIGHLCEAQHARLQVRCSY